MDLRRSIEAMKECEQALPSGVAAGPAGEGQILGESIDVSLKEHRVGTRETVPEELWLATGTGHCRTEVWSLGLVARLATISVTAHGHERDVAQENDE